MLEIDGSAGEGGGQVLRTALGLSLATGRPFRIRGIRAGRERPGLLRQHLAAVRAAAAIGEASVEGDHLGSTTLSFTPRGLRAGEHHAAIGSAGSALLVIQAVLPGLLVAGGPSRLVVEGGTHNPAAPPYPFLSRVFLPLLRRMGATVELTLDRPGFYPAGGGRVVLEVVPAPLRPLVLLERGDVLAMTASAITSGLNPNVAHRQLLVLRDRFRLGREALIAETVASPRGPGNAVFLEVQCAHVTEGFTAIGERGRTAEAVASTVAEDADVWLAHGHPVGEHLADQLLVPMSLAPGSVFRTGALSSHARTNLEGVARFVPLPQRVVELEGGGVEVGLG